MEFPYEMIEVSDELKPFVHRFISMNAKLDQAFDIEAMPTGHMFFSNYFGQKAPQSEFRFVDHVAVPDSRWTLVGQMLSGELFFYEPHRLQYFVCELEPTTCYRLFGVNGSDMAAKAVSLLEVAPHIVSLAEKCFVAGEDASKEEYLREAELFFGELAANAGDEDAMIEDAVALLKTRNGAMTIIDVAKELKVEIRTLNRRFFKVVGLPPKYYAKTLQINWALGQMMSGDNKSLTDIALNAGFFDQAHLSNAVKLFFKQSPNAFLDSKHIELETFFDEISGKGPVLKLSQGDD